MNMYKIDGSELKTEICRVLGWTDLQYCLFKEETGIRYLRQYLPNQEYLIDFIVREAAFWNWWKNRWDLRDKAFLNIRYTPDENLSFIYASFDCSGKFTRFFDVPDMNDFIIESDYHQMHSPEELVKEMPMPGIALGRSGEKMIQSLQRRKAVPA